MIFFTTSNSKSVIAALRIVAIEKSELTFLLTLCFHGVDKDTQVIWDLMIHFPVIKLSIFRLQIILFVSNKDNRTRVNIFNDNTRVILQTIQSLLFFHCKIDKFFRCYLNAKSSFLQAAKICLYDNFLIPWIKSRLRSKSISYKRLLIISKVPHKL